MRRLRRHHRSMENSLGTGLSADRRSSPGCLPHWGIGPAHQVSAVAAKGINHLSERMADSETVRLADFIRANIDPIVEEWVKFARTRTPASESMTRLALQDHIVELLTFIADDLETAQTHKEQVEKSQGLGAANGEFTRSAAEIH